MVTVAFDLDLTLADTRAGVRRALSLLAQETGRYIDVEQAVARLGIPMPDELAHWFPVDEVQEAALRSRALFVEVGVPLCAAFEGAKAALALLRDQGLAIHVVTSRHPDVAAALLDAVGLADLVSSNVDGLVFGPAKVSALRRLSPVAYVGDHPADMAAGVSAGVTAIGVTTGNHGSGELREAGATAVISGLSALPRVISTGEEPATMTRAGGVANPAMTDPPGPRGTHAERVRRATIQVIFETHSTSTDNENGIASGHADPPLSSLGEEQAQQLGLRYATQQVDAVYCSDLQRSYRTGEIAFATRPALVTRDARLRECDYGALTRAPGSQIAAEKHRRVRAPFRDGESYEDCARRVREALREIAHRHPGGTVLVIGHRATQYGLAHCLCGVDLERAVTAPWQWQPGWTYPLPPEQI